MNDTLDAKVCKDSFAENTYFQTLYNMIPNPLFTIDTENRITSWNKRAEHVTGYSYAEVLGKDCNLLENGHCFINGKLVYDNSIMPILGIECTIKDKIGNTLTISKSIDIIKDVKGFITGIITSFEDITERVKSETLLKLMTRTSPLAFLVVDNRTDEIMYFNHKFCQIWGITNIEDQMLRGEFTNNQIIPYCLPVLANIPAFAESCKPLQSEENRTTIEDYIEFVGDRTIRRFSTQMRGANDEYFGRFYIFEDITDKKSIEDKLRESEENFRTLFDTIDDLLLVGDTKGAIIHMNNAVLNKLEYSVEELYNMHILDLHPQEIRAEAEKVLNDLLEGKKSNCPLPLKSKSGLLLPVETKVWPGKWNGVDCIYGVSKDLSKQQASMDKFQKLFDSNPSLLVVSSMDDSRIEDVNAAFIDKLGYSREEIIGKTSKELDLFIDFNKQITTSMNLKENGKIRDVELQIRKKNGQVIDGLFSGEIIDNQVVKKYLTVITDITKQKIIEKELLIKDRILSAVAQSIKELLDNRDYYSAIANCFELLGEATAVDRVYLFQNHFDESGIGYTSQKIEWNSGYKASQIDNPELQDVSFADMSSFIEPLVNGEAFYGIVRCLENGYTRGILESQGILSIVVLPVFLQDRFWGFVGFDECKYEREWMEVECLTLSAFVNALEKAIERAQIEQELEIARHAADVANIAKSRFLANMSHEIRTPMNAVIAYSELLNAFELNEKQHDYINKIMISSQMLLSIINDILDLNKMEAGMIEMESIPFLLDVILDNATSQVRIKSDNKGLQLKTNIDSGVTTGLNGDPLRLQQILTNLIDNAVKFTNKGCVEINVISIAIDHINTELIFSVSDTGIGIRKERIDDIFEPFSQTDAEISRKYGGTGLGLTICKNIANLFGGKIWVESEPGEGSTFFFTAKFKINKNLLSGLSPDIKEANKVSNAVTVEQIRGAHVLLVEDNEINQDVMIEILHTAELVVTVANNGMEAIDFVKKNDFDIILMDIRMSVMGGFEATSEIRKFKSFDELPIIAVTAGTILSEREIKMRHHFNGHLNKPVNITQLFQVIAQNIRKGQKTELNKESNIEFKEALVKDLEIVGYDDTIPYLDGIDVDTMLTRLGGNKTLVRNLLIKFSNNQKETVKDILGTLESEDYETAERLAHSIKGLAGIIAANDLFIIAADIEKQIRAGNSPVAKELTVRLDMEIKRVLVSIEKLEQNIEMEQSFNFTTVNMPVIRQLLDKLLKLLLDNDFEAIKCADELLRQAHGTPIEQRVLELKSYTDQYRYDDSVKEISEINHFLDGESKDGV